MVQALKQAWWAPVAGLLVLGQLVLAVAILVSGDDDNDVVAGVAIALSGALALSVGLWKRPRARKLGNALIVVGALLAAFWFWTLWGPIGALIVLIGLAITEVRSREPAHAGA